MSHRNAIARVCVAAFVVAMLPAAPAEAGTSTPFFLTGCSTSTSFTPGVFPVLGTGYTESKGQATYLGSYTGTDTVTLLWTPSGVYFEGPSAFAAANGDKLYAYACGWMDENLESEATWTFTGGTGRFAGATGSGVFRGYWTEEGTAISWAEGTIRLKGDDDND